MAVGYIDITEWLYVTVMVKKVGVRGEWSEQSPNSTHRNTNGNEKGVLNPFIQELMENPAMKYEVQHWG